MLGTILIILVVIIAAILLFASTRPNTFVVERAATMKAAPEKVFPMINDFHNWGSWSPWEKLDPAMKKNISGAPNGKGAVYEWEGNSKAGKGRMEITDATSPSKVNINLDFEKPFRATNKTEIMLVPQGDSTNVTWRMTGDRPFMMKVMGLFMNMDNLIGKDFEEGLANIRRLAEK